MPNHVTCACGKKLEVPPDQTDPFVSCPCGRSVLAAAQRPADAPSSGCGTAIIAIMGIGLLLLTAQVAVGGIPTATSVAWSFGVGISLSTGVALIRFGGGGYTTRGVRWSENKDLRGRPGEIEEFRTLRTHREYRQMVKGASQGE